MNTISNTRPSPELRKDRLARYHRECEENRQHIAKTIERNLGDCQRHWELLDHCVRTNQTDKAIRWAAEVYCCRGFVLGVITGRGYMLPDDELTKLKRSWEDQWDKAFGDLVGQTLKMQE